MALLFIEGFDQYDIGTFGQSGKFIQGLGTAPAIAASPGASPFSPQCLSCSNDNDIFALFPTPAATTTIIFGFGYYHSTTYSNSIINLYTDVLDNSTNRMCYLDHNLGNLSWVIEGGATTSLATNVIQTGVWHWIEVKVTLSGTTPSPLELRVDGNTVYTGSIITTRSTMGDSPILKAVRFSDLDSRYMYLDDIYVCDSSGSTNNDFLGRVSVVALKPNGNGAVNNFTPVGAANNWECVDNAGRNSSDTAYVYSTTPGHKDLYTFQNLDPKYTNVKGVAFNGSIRAVGDSGQKMKFVINNQSSSRQISYVYDDKRQFITETSDGTNAWTPATVNSVEAGFEVE